MRDVVRTKVAGADLDGAQAVVDTGTVSAADDLVRSVVGWRDTCAPSRTHYAGLGTSGLTAVPLPGDSSAYRWTFVYTAMADAGPTTIEEVSVVRVGSWVSVAVVSGDVPGGTARTLSSVDVTALTRVAAARLS